MRVLFPILLLIAGSAVLSAPPASACHPDPAVSGLPSPKDYYVVPNAGIGGCPHEPTLCIEVWRESNGEPGLQRRGWTPDTAILIVCPLP